MLCVHSLHHVESCHPDEQLISQLAVFNRGQVVDPGVLLVGDSHERRSVVTEANSVERRGRLQPFRMGDADRMRN